MLRAILFASAAFVSVAHITPVRAAETDAASVTADVINGRGQSLPPILALMRDSGVKITALTPIVSGLPGYLLEDASGKMQVVYVTSDGNSVVAGVQQAIAPDHRSLQNVTTVQFASLKNSFDAARRKVEDEKRDADDARRRADEAADALTDQQRQIGEAAKQFGTGTQIAPSPADAAAPSPAQSATPAGAPSAAADPERFLTKTDQDRKDGKPGKEDLKAADFRAIAEKAAYFRVGKLANPTLYIVADPQCPHCHQAWHYLDPLVRSGAITVKVILIAGLPHSEPLAVSILTRQNPGKVWLDGEGSTDGPIAAGPPEASPAARQAEGWLRTNMGFIQAMKVTGTPWMAYAGQDGKVYHYAGDSDVALADFVAGMPKPEARGQ